VGQLEELERQKQKPGGVCAWKQKLNKQLNQREAKKNKNTVNN